MRWDDKNKNNCCCVVSFLLSTLEEKNSNLSKIEVDEVTSLVSHVASKVSANNAMPSWVIFLVKLFFDVSSNVLFNVVFLERLSCTVHCILLHLLRHVSIFDHGLSFSHFDLIWWSGNLVTWWFSFFLRESLDIEIWFLRTFSANRKIEIESEEENL